MFERVTFLVHSVVMVNYVKLAKAEKHAGNDAGATGLLRRALVAGRKALHIESSKISEKRRTALYNTLALLQDLYRQDLISQMPKEDRDLLTSVIKYRSDTHSIIVDTCPNERMIGMFDIAKSRLGTKRETLGLIYDGNHVPAPLRNTMHSYLRGELTREETEARLVACAATLRKWLPELFPSELVPAQ